ncbi:hypothetical protein HPP92_025706 [Vanilla planifolia]|uniref:Uncharacterized protein n=1 Tax=Vanilla planifolia TaxID=51239 RepID=A0A835PMU5_VANPL|nr:hypothetical protein HPP92_025706 [Vanilla planifolia]
MAQGEFHSFRQRRWKRGWECFVRDEDERPKVVYNEFSDDIPVISLAGIDEEGEGAGGLRFSGVSRRREEWGIFQVVEHGVDAGLIREMTHPPGSFFVVARGETRYDMSGGNKGGYVVSSHLQGSGSRLAELDVLYPITARDYSRWPEKPVGGRAVAEEYSTRLMDLAQAPRRDLGGDGP